MNQFYKNNKGIKILTPDGYKDFSGIALMGNKPTYDLTLENDLSLKLTFDHKVFVSDGQYKEAGSLSVSDTIKTINGDIKFKSINSTGYTTEVYDVIDVDGNKFYANDILVHNCQFVSSDETLVDSMVLASLNGIDPEFFTGQVRWYEEPKANYTYLVALDPSLGTGSDPAAIQVFELPGMTQVAEWQHNLTPPKQQMKILMNILLVLQGEMEDDPDQEGEPEIYWTVENNSIGETVLQIIEDTGEMNFPGTLVSEKVKAKIGRRKRKGLNTTNSNKLSACAKLKSLVETNRMALKSKQLIRQLKFFVGNGASYAAKSGEHDDLIMAMILCVRLLDLLKNRIDEEYIEDLAENLLDDDDDSMPMPTQIG